MRIRVQAVLVLLASIGALALTSCASPLGGRAVDRPVAVAGLERSSVVTEMVPVAAPDEATTYYAPCDTPCGSPCATPCATPCAPAPCDPCGLPCENGCGTWHVRAVGGYSFQFGTDSGDGCGYLGGDVGYVSPCCCWGLDVFYRTTSGEFDREVPVVGAVPYLGTDVGRFHFIGVKATYERSINNSRWFGYAGLGPVYFWTDDYVNDDTGFGGFAELGLGYRLNRHWRLRGGVELIGVSTDAGRLDPADDGNARWLFFVSPVAQVQFDF